MLHLQPPLARGLAAGALLASLVGTASAQFCPLPDNLTPPPGVCWEPTDLNVPDFPDLTRSAAGICWEFCDPQPKVPSIVTVTTPVPTICGQFLSSIRVSTAFGVPVLSGTATLDYTRTWEESASDINRRYQVWRFAVKIDFKEEPNAPPVCYKPPCLGGPIGFDTCFWYGYIDYALNCNTGEFENAVVLYHNCDDFIHNPFLSDRPAPVGAAFHPNTQYAIVAPDSAVNPFVPAILTPRSGDLVAEAVRNVTHPFGPNVCLYEDPIQNGLFQLLGTACLCPLASVPPMQSASQLEGITVCGSSFLSLQLFNPQLRFLWFRLIGASLGTWTTTAAYPGEEAPFALEGFFLYHDSCAEIFGDPPDTLDLMYGAKTTKGFQVIDSPVSPPLTQNFVDLASNYSQPFVALPLLGSVRPTDHLIYVNMP